MVYSQGPYANTTLQLWMYPRDWLSETCNIQFWRQHQKGGHFIAWERPETLADDVSEFYGKSGPVFGSNP